MKKFIVIYHAPKEAAMKMASVSPEEAKKGMELWFAIRRMLRKSFQHFVILI